MTNYIRRLIYVDDKKLQKVNPLAYPFLFCSFFYGLGFTFLGAWSGVNSSSLFTALHNIHTFLPHIWGIFALLASVFAVILILTRTRGGLGEFAALFGFSVWLFAALTYALNGFWLVFFSVALTNAFFWGWYYMRVKWYERMKASGNLIDVE